MDFRDEQKNSGSRIRVDALHSPVVRVTRANDSHATGRSQLRRLATSRMRAWQWSRDTRVPVSGDAPRCQGADQRAALQDCDYRTMADACSSDAKRAVCSRSAAGNIRIRGDVGVRERACARTSRRERAGSGGGAAGRSLPRRTIVSSGDAHRHFSDRPCLPAWERAVATPCGVATAGLRTAARSRRCRLSPTARGRRAPRALRPPPAP